MKRICHAWERSGYGGRYHLGGASGTIVKSLDSDVLMPPIGLMMGGVDFANFFPTMREGATAGPYHALADAQAAGASIVNWGIFANSIISFVIVVFAVFMVIRKIKLKENLDLTIPLTPFSKGGIS